ncbi:MAG: dephospho-CoA kinase [Candidatus Thioglobus sp.]|nr:dephospho-CoA kinase [Candidatus Thioglobus sp.]
MAILKIALTGGIACGKSSVGQMFGALAVPIIELDRIAREVVCPSSKALEALVMEFGVEILNADKTLNRGILRQLLLKNPSNRQLIEAILHPQILAKMHAEIAELELQANAKLVIIEVALLAEKNLSDLFDRAINVDCSKENQLSRLLQRDKISKALAEKMIAAQASPQQRFELADKLPTDIIENNSDRADLEKKVVILSQELLNL